jgi:hypothetical protein
MDSVKLDEANAPPALLNTSTFHITVPGEFNA